MDASQDLIARARALARDPDAITTLAQGLGPGPFALVMLFVSPEADVPALARAAESLPAAHVIGCTTAGEISDQGYEDGTVLAMGFPARHFAAEVLELPDLDRFSRAGAAAGFLQLRQSLAASHAELPHEFALLLVDGLSLREDDLASALAAGAGSVPLIGGSAGDGSRFEQTQVLHAGKAMRNAAVLAVLRSRCPVRALNTDHLAPTPRRMVVTGADPAARIVHRINAEPAAREYARILGQPVDSIDHGTFASHPLAVRIGGRCHVRAVRRVLPSGDLLFFSAIDEGMVLILAEPQDLPGHLERQLAQLSRPAPPVAVLGFDCILRRIEAQQKQMTGAVSDTLRRHRVWGFSTYGEQFGPLHVNHTLTGCVIYPPGTQLPETAP